MNAAELSDLVHKLPPWAVVLFVVVNLLVTLCGTGKAVLAGARGTLAAGRWYGRRRSRRLDQAALERVRKMPWGAETAPGTVIMTVAAPKAG